MYNRSTQPRSQTQRKRAESTVEWVGNFVRHKHEPNAEDFLLASQIDTETLNQMIEEGKNKGQSVAFWLSES